MMIPEEEKVLMISPEGNPHAFVTTNGTMELPQRTPPIDSSVSPSLRSWLSSRFTHVFLVLALLVAMLLSALILIVVLLTRLNDVQADSHAQIHQAAQNMGNMMMQAQMNQFASANSGSQNSNANSNFNWNDPRFPNSAQEPQLQNSNSNPEMPPCTGGANCENSINLPEGFTLPPGIKLPTPPSPPPGAPPAVKAQIFGPQPRMEHTDNQSFRRKFPKPRYTWRDPSCETVGQCKLAGYTKPPLLIVSFDGFSREYLNRGILKSLDYFSECGAKADRVIPSYPSRTFPNHYTIVTGFYPEDHQIVDNNIFDPTLSPKFESMKSTKIKEFWGGDPIWSVYKRQTGNRANCYFFLGCTHNVTGYPPDIAPPYNENVPFKSRMDTIVEWLSSSVEQRPGLITAYFDQPDTIGHYHTTDEETNKKLKELDEDLDYFFGELHGKGLFECINIVILSDHGMQSLNQTYYMSEMFANVDGIVSAPGVVGRVYRNGTNKSPDELAQSLACSSGDKYRVFTRFNIPIRKHYAKTPRIGEVILQGQPGSTFFVSPETLDPFLTSDHGYDPLQEEMHTVFFARGPSIQPKVTVPAFQNIEYMNLWLDLLNLKYVPNNGTVGVLHDVLKKKPPQPRKIPATLIPECQLSLALPGYRACGSCADFNETRLIGSSLLRCSLSGLQPPFISSHSLCFMNYCNNTLIASTKASEESRFLMEQLTLGNIETSKLKNPPSPCYFENTKYAYSNCTLTAQPYSNHMTVHSIAVNNRTEFSHIAGALHEFPAGFYESFLTPLNDLSASYVKKFGRIISFSGLVHDKDIDGICDFDRSGSPTHFVRQLFACPAESNISNIFECSTEMWSMGFIFPIISKDPNCLPPEHLLLEYSARIRDIELISNLQFIFPKLDLTKAAQLRTKINLSL